jgi:uncharacterized protein YqeY
MPLQENIDQDIKSAMLSKDSTRLRGLRAIKAALLVAKTEKGAQEVLTEEAELKVLQNWQSNVKSLPIFTSLKIARIFIR